MPCGATRRPASLSPKVVRLSATKVPACGLVRKSRYLSPGSADRRRISVSFRNVGHRRWRRRFEEAWVTRFLDLAACRPWPRGGEVTELPSSSCRALESKADGDPDVLIASDLPRQGGSRLQTTQMVGAMRLLLDDRDWKAGDYNIAYQDCDDATAQAGKWDSGKCSQNANAYASNESVIAVVGTFNSGCAAIEIPVLNNAPGGGLLMISPAN